MFKKLVAIFLALGMLIVPIPIKVMAATETDGFLVPVTQKDTVPYGYTGIYTAEDFNNIRENLSGQYIASVYKGILHKTTKNGLPTY